MSADDLLDPSRFGYGRATLSVDVGTRTWRLAALDGFERNVATVYRTLAGRSDGRDPGDWMPMFGVLWPGAVALARRVSQHPRLAGKRVLELGCGLGLPSLVASDRGAEVVATDHHPHAEAFLRANARHNRVDVAYRHLDWRDLPPDLGLFDLVIASDLLFSEALAPLVARTIAQTLAPDGEAWLVDPGRLALGSFERATGLQRLLYDVDVLDEGDASLYAITLRWPAKSSTAPPG
jgi:predicted nicotinamide N-methyase